MQSSEFSRYIRKPFEINAILITEENLVWAADLIGDGKIRTKDDGSAYFLAEPQLIRGISRVEPGFWMTKADNTYRVYKPHVFEKIFWEATDERDAILEVLASLDAEEVADVV